jgi:DNA-binding NarL/FixJ family response regulator
MIKRPRIVIADDHALVAELCKRLLETEFDVVGLVSDGPALLGAAGKLKPDVIVVDIAMPVLNGLEAATISAAAHVFSRYPEAPRSKASVAVRDVLRGKSYISQGLSRDAIDCLRRQNKKLVQEDERLTDRQREGLQLLAEGKVMKEVGGILNMTSRTVAYHKYRMMEVLGAKSTAELASTPLETTW